MASVTGTFTATGAGSAFTPKGGTRPTSNAAFNIELRGTFTATVALQRSLDGTNWVTVTMVGTPVSWTDEASESWEEVESGAQYRLNCTAFTSGTVNYRISQ